MRRGFIMQATDIDIDIELAVPSLDDILVDAATGSERFELLAQDEEAIQAAIAAVEADLKEAAGPSIEGGTSRAIFKTDGVIVKSPLEDGNYGALSNCYSNLAEVAAFEHSFYAGQVVPCRTVWHRSGVPLVIMEMVDCRIEFDYSVSKREDFPAWAYEIDGAQVAWSDLIGGWACYDAGYPAPDLQNDEVREYRGTERMKAWLDQVLASAEHDALAWAA